MARILVVDDDVQMRRLLREALTRARHTVDEAVDGLHALSRFAESHPDLVIVDLIMPEREGIETIQALRRGSPALPIIAISGGGRSSPESYLSIAIGVGANRAYRKPFRLEDILAAVNDLTAPVA